MAVTTTKTNKPINPRGDDKSPLAFNRAKIYSGKALDFDGVNDSIDVAPTIGIENTSFSIITNVLVDSASGSFRIFQNRGTGSAGNVAGIQLSGIPQAGKYNWSNTYVDDGAGNFLNLEGNLTEFDLDKWYNLSLTWDTLTGTMKFYLNGVLVDTKVNTDLIGADLDGPENWIVAGASSTQFLNGQVSNLKAFNTALTAAQVLELYNNPEKIVPTGVDNTALKLWLPMMEGAGTTAYDGSGNGNHGTISGATWTHGIGAPVAQSAVIDWNKGANKAQYSEEFENAYWGLVDTQTPTANDTTAPDGQTTADKIVPSTNNAIHYIFNTAIALTGQNTISVFAKYNGYNIGIRPQGIGSGQAFANFDLQNGTILGSGGTSYDDSSITSFGDGWYRISMTMDNASTYGINFYAVNGTTATELPTFTADGTSGYYLWGAQVEQADAIGPYIPTLSTAQTTPVLLPQGLTSGRDITGVNLFENVRKQYALNLDGNSWAEVHDNESLDITDAITLEAWVYWDGTANDDGILGRWGQPTADKNYMLYAMNSGTLRFYINSNSVSVGVSNGWNHVVGTYDKMNMKIYVNSSLGSSSANTADITTSAKPIEIGRYYHGYDAGQRLYTNAIAQPRIYNRALTADEVEQNYNAGKNTYS